MIRALYLCALLALATPATAEPRIIVAGGWYGEQCTNGEFVQLLINSHIETDRGRVGLPPGGNLLFNRHACDGSGRFGGIGHLDDRAYLWSGSSFSSDSLAFGPNAVIFDVRKVFRVVWGPGTPTGSQGWRYVADSGELVTAEETYADPINHLWEFTIRGDIRCGQGGDEEGLQCLVRGRRVLVEPGVIRRIVFNREGDRIGLAWVRQDNGTAGRWLTTAAELAALPTYTLPDNPPPPPPPPPSKQECGDIPANGQTLLRQLADKFAAEIHSLDDEQRRRWALRAAQQMAFSVDRAYGSKRADSGRPQTKDGIAKQLGNRLCVWDIVNGDTRQLQFSHGEDITGQVFIPVEPIDHLGTEPPPPPSNELSKRVDALERALKSLAEELVAAEVRLSGRIDKIQNGVPEERVNALIDAAFASAVISGRTQSAGGILSHSHGITGLSIGRK